MIALICMSQEKVGIGSSADSGKGKSKMSKGITHGYHLVEGKSHHTMEDYVVSEFKQVGDNELGLFAIFDGHLSHVIPDYLKSNLFDNILKEVSLLCSSPNQHFVLNCSFMDFASIGCNRRLQHRISVC